MKIKDQICPQCLTTRDRQGSKLKLRYLLLSALSFQLLAAIFCQARAESGAPQLTSIVQKVVYEARQLMEKREYLKAKEYLENFIEKNPQQRHYLVEFTLGNVLAMAGKNKEALLHYRDAVNLYPAFAAAWQNMGKLYFDLKQYDDAGDCLLKGHELNAEKDPDLLYYAAVSYIMGKKEKKALPYIEHLAGGETGDPKIEWLETLLKVYLDLQLKEKAFKVVQRLLNKNQNDPRWWKLLAKFHLEQNDYKNGLVALTVLSYLTAPDLQDYMLLADLSSAIGLPSKAAEYYQKALMLENGPVNYEKLASAYIAAHKPVKAEEVLSRALEKKPTSKLWFMMGQVLYEDEEFDKAHNAFNQSAQLDPKGGEAHLMMGYCALQMDRNDAARTAFQKASRFPKACEAAQALLKQIASIVRN